MQMAVIWMKVWASFNDGTMNFKPITKLKSRPMQKTLSIDFTKQQGIINLFLH
jgi:hypothetical protein